MKGRHMQLQQAKKYSDHVYTGLEMFSELLGVMYGDGCLYVSTYSLCICGNTRLDSYYLEHHVYALFLKTFYEKGTLYCNPSYTRFVINSIRCVTWLESLGYPRGSKKNQELPLPSFIFSSNRYAAAFIRGIFDTDGGLYAHPHTGVMLDITSKIPSLRKQIHALLCMLNLKGSYTETGFVCYGMNAVRFMHLIGSSNPRIVQRYKAYIAFGVVGRARDQEIDLKKAACASYPYFGPMI